MIVNTCRIHDGDEYEDDGLTWTTMALSKTYGT
jgi:hypothetical protein